MKPSKILFCTALVGVTALAANIASAVPGYFNVSSTATTSKTTVLTTNKEVEVLVKHSFGTKDVLKLLANGTGQLWISNKNSHLLYDPGATNAAASTWYGQPVFGIFWATNTISHDSYRLDSTNSINYWSYIELDYFEWDLGFWNPYNLIDNTPVGENYAYSRSLKSSPHKYTGKEVGSDAIFYVHDNPNDYDYLDYGGNVLFDNDNAAVIRGPITLTWSVTSTHSRETISFSGAGDGQFYISGTGNIWPVLTGKATFSGKD